MPKDLLHRRERDTDTQTPKVEMRCNRCQRWFGGSRGEEEDTVTGQQKSAYDETSSPVETVLLVASCTHTHIHMKEIDNEVEQRSYLTLISNPVSLSLLVPTNWK